MNTKSKGHKDNGNYNHIRLPTYILKLRLLVSFSIAQ